MGLPLTATAPPGGTNVGASMVGGVMQPPASVSTATAKPAHTVRDITPPRCLTPRPGAAFAVRFSHHLPRREGRGYAQVRPACQGQIAIALVNGTDRTYGTYPSHKSYPSHFPVTADTAPTPP